MERAINRPQAVEALNKALKLFLTVLWATVYRTLNSSAVIWPLPSAKWVTSTEETKQKVTKILSEECTGTCERAGPTQSSSREGPEGKLYGP